MDTRSERMLVSPVNAGLPASLPFFSSSGLPIYFSAFWYILLALAIFYILLPSLRVLKVILTNPQKTLKLFLFWILILFCTEVSSTVDQHLWPHGKILGVKITPSSPKDPQVPSQSRITIPLSPRWQRLNQVCRGMEEKLLIHENRPMSLCTMHPINADKDLSHTLHGWGGGGCL